MIYQRSIIVARFKKKGSERSERSERSENSSISESVKQQSTNRDKLPRAIKYKVCKQPRAI